MSEVRDILREAIKSGDGEQLNQAIERWLKGTLNDTEAFERMEIEREGTSAQKST